MKDKQKRNLSFHSIRFKINFIVLLGGVLLLVFSTWLMSDSMSKVENHIMDGRLSSDIRLLRDTLGENDGAHWSEKDGALYIGDTLIGDGTPQNAYEEPFYHCEEITGTFFYSFVRTYNDDKLVYVESGGYQQGHYLRTAGTTKGPNGEDIEGTYMDKKVADILESSPDGSYSGEANVNGRMIYCRYELLKNENGETVGAIVVGHSIAEMQKLVQNQKIRSVVLILAALVLISIAITLIISAMLRAIEIIKERLQRIGAGELPSEPLHLRTKDEMSEIAENVNEMVESLREKERIGAELSLATDIQANMLPSIFPPFPGHDEVDIYATMNPAKEVGGDFYDIFMLDDQNVVVVIADVSGKGVPAALFMVIAKTLIKNHAQIGMAPSEVFTKVNHMLCEGNEAGLFVTGWMGLLNTETGKLTYVNAGHNPPMIKLGDAGFQYLKSRPGFVLAGMDGVRYRQNELQMQPGDRLFLYTDGVTEATSAAKELYGEDRLSSYLNAHTDDGVRELLHGLRADIDEFVGAAEQFDDITMLILDYQKKQIANMVEREFPAEDEQLHAIMTFIEEEMEKLQASPRATTQLCVAAEEIFVNIAHYAYLDAAGNVKHDGTMKLGVGHDNDEVTLRFVDRGLPFDPLAKNDPDVTLSAEERSIGGLGIYLVKKTMDHVEYKYQNGQNIFTISKKLHE